MTQDGNEHLLTVREVADRLRVDEATVRRWIENGVLEAIALPHLGKRKISRIRAATIEAIMHPTKE
jgi:excisionase family DNA binding protein